MTTAEVADRAMSDPIGLIVELVTGIEDRLDPDTVAAVVASVAGGRAKTRRLASFMGKRPQVLLDGRSPAPRVVGELLIALRRAGAETVSPPCCIDCGRVLSTLQRSGQDWHCGGCRQNTAACSVCGNICYVSSRDRTGQPRCTHCPDRDDRDPITVITALIAELDPTVDHETVADAVRSATSRPSYRRQLAWALEVDPTLLTGNAHLAPLRVVVRFVEMLHDAGITGITRPACPGCGRTVRIDKPLNGQRVCRTCMAHTRYAHCGRCGAFAEPITRDDTGRPICSHCFVTDPANLETCLGCGRRRAVGRRTPDGPLCPSCHHLLVTTCAICGDTTGCGTSRITGRPWCPPCQRRSAPCSVCGTDAAVVSGTVAAPVCGDCTPAPAWRDCPTCADPEHPNPGRCARCLLGARLDEVMGTVTDTAPAMRALRAGLAAAENPGTAIQWLTKQRVAPVISGLATGRIPLTHAALDELTPTPTLAHLRQTLVATGALPERDEEMIHLQQFLTNLLADQPDQEQRKLLHRYIIWHLVRRLRSRNNGAPTTRQQVLRIRSHARAAIAFLDWLATRGLTLGACGQTDLETWQTDPAGGYRQATGTFIRWARAEKLTTLTLAAEAWQGPVHPIDNQHRWDTARRLLHDDTLKPEDRLAGLLLLLYAQGPSAIARMRVDQIRHDPDHIRLIIGTTPIHLPEPVADLARTVTHHRKGHATIGAAAPSPWLFPGGQPGRPISTARLTARLNALGITPLQNRSTALFQLATEVPAAILARTLGIQTEVAVKWQRYAAGDWHTYAAEISQRTRHSDSSNI